MNDLDHFIGGDINVGPTADLGVATATDATNQRVLRRLITNPGDYPWHPEYGAGLPAEIGRLADERRIRGIILSHIFMEPSVARTPPPVIGLVIAANTVAVRIQYVDAQSGQIATLSFDVNR